LWTNVTFPSAGPACGEIRRKIPTPPPRHWALAGRSLVGFVDRVALPVATLHEPSLDEEDAPQRVLRDAPVADGDGLLELSGPPVEIGEQQHVAVSLTGNLLTSFPRQRE
jgi:hypothetical protein